MIRNIGMHGAYDTQVIHTTPDIREDFTDLDTALAELAKLKRGGNAAPVRRSVFSVMGIGFPANLVKRASDRMCQRVMRLRS